MNNEICFLIIKQLFSNKEKKECNFKIKRESASVDQKQNKLWIGTEFLVRCFSRIQADGNSRNAVEKYTVGFNKGLSLKKRL